MGFFERLLGSRPRTAANAPDDGTEVLSADDHRAATSRIAQIEGDLSRGDGEIWSLQEELGTLQERLGDRTAAIAAYESSLAGRPRYGECYTRLLDLYNAERARAAEAGDAAAINRWMSKIDDLLATSKRIMRENY